MHGKKNYFELLAQYHLGVDCSIQRHFVLAVKDVIECCQEQLPCGGFGGVSSSATSLRFCFSLKPESGYSGVS